MSISDLSEQSPTFGEHTQVLGDSSDHSPTFGEQIKNSQCSVCGKTFKTRQSKYYHKSKFARGTGCNIVERAGRPGLRTEEERKEKRKAANDAYNLKMKEKRALRR